MTDLEIENAGFVDHPYIEMCGCSPDGLLPDGGIIEVKSPLTSTFIDYLLSDKVPTEYVNQVQWQLECTERNWGYFVAYDPRMPIDLQLFVKKFERDQDRIDEIKIAVRQFLREVDLTIESLNKLRGAK